MWDLVPWAGIEPGSPALAAQSLSHWAAREVPVHVYLIAILSCRLKVGLSQEYDVFLSLGLEIGIITRDTFGCWITQGAHGTLDETPNWGKAAGGVNATWQNGQNWALCWDVCWSWFRPSRVQAPQLWGQQGCSSQHSQSSWDWLVSLEINQWPWLQPENCFVATADWACLQSTCQFAWEIFIHLFSGYEPIGGKGTTWPCRNGKQMGGCLRVGDIEDVGQTGPASS